MSMKMQFADHLRNDQDLGNFINDDVDHHHDHDMINHEIEPFHIIGKGVPKSNDSSRKKICWLSSQIIGASTDFKTPFGRRRLTYADHTASARSLHYVENYITTKFLPFYGNSHTSDSYVGYQTTKLVHEATNYVKKCLGGGEEDAIIFCGSGSTAAIKRLQEVMGISIPSILRERVLDCLSVDERWVVFIGPYEHHSNILSWRQSLAEVVEIGLDCHGQIDMDELRKNLSYYRLKNRLILGSFSACSNVTGIFTDTRAVARLLHQYGAFVCFDFAARSGYTGDTVDGSSPPSTCGGGTVDYVNNFDEKDTIYLDNIEEREDAGTPQNIQKVRAALAFSIKEYIGYKAIETLEKSYIGRALQRLLPNPNIWILGNTDVKRQAILSFLVCSSSSANKGRGKPLHASFIAKLLNDLFGIQARGGCACAGPYGHSLLNINNHHSLAYRSTIQKGYSGIKPGWTRVSFPYYISEEEFEFIIAAIEFIAIYGQRFLWLYNFTWSNGSWTFEKNINPSLASMVKELNIEGNDKQANMKQDVVLGYTNYLETAKRIVTLLPKFPPRREIPQEIDVDFVAFRV